ncbi:hypothetical protein [Jannaschia pohangensis]|uniref:Uncharacterized protein n=1 Tax=Jannaschia pohangensis TaxID=390807 RepID=A0A1I3SJG9_9RHOB|nr:hypothetical protein [Jannaschia pohangensis]SFJ58884.1 hypothetical protein SAMN04488095_3179 [Jannaschia pohangensis]
MNSFTYDISGGGVTVRVTVTEIDGDLRFDLDVLEISGTIGDLNALYLDILDESLLDGLSVVGADVTGTAFDANSVTKIDNFTTIKGEVLKEFGAFDLGVQFGTQGIGKDDIQSVSFVLTHESEALTLDLFIGQDTAARLTSVGEIDGSRDRSLKIGGVADPIDLPDDDGPIVDEPPVEEDPVGEDDPIIEEPPVEEEPVGEDGPIVEEPPVEEEPVGEDDPIIEEPPVEEEPTDDVILGEDVPADDEFVFVDDTPVDEGPADADVPEVVIGEEPEIIIGEDLVFDEEWLIGEGPIPEYGADDIIG